MYNKKVKYTFGGNMFITDIMAVLCSGGTLAFMLINIQRILRLPAMIGDTNIPASERNIKLFIFIVMVIFILIALVKFVTSVGKLIFRLCSYNKGRADENSFFTKMFVKSATVPFRKLIVGGNIAVVAYSLIMFLVAFPNLRYDIGAGRTLETRNINEHRIWEMSWFYPMLQTLLILFVIGLLISILRLKIAKVNHEYDELYALSESRKMEFLICRACGFDNHVSSIRCADCETALRFIPDSVPAPLSVSHEAGSSI